MMALFKRLKVPDENVLRERLHGLRPYPPSLLALAGKELVALGVMNGLTLAYDPPATTISKELYVCFIPNMTEGGVLYDELNQLMKKGN
jgi:hypothetical protein